MDDEDLDASIDERRRLVALAYRMLGTTGEAEDAVQETYIRWYRLSDDERAAISIPQAWLTRVLSRICLDALTTARARREIYVGEWLPEPLPAGHFSPGDGAADPLDRVTLDDAVSSALLVVLETMSPPERIAFVLHDAFGMPFPEIATIVGRTPAAVRQLATSARRHVRLGRPRPVSRSERDSVVTAFAAAARAGDLAGLVALLDPSVTLRSDGGGIISAARRPVHGADRVARFLFGAMAKHPETTLDELRTTDGLAFAMRADRRVIGIVNFHVVGGVIADVWMMLNPEKLNAWRR